MVDTNLDSINRKLLNLMQSEFPLTRKPYAEMGIRLDISESDILNRIEQLKASRIIRQISPVLDARRLGYQTTLVAMKVSESQLDNSEQVIAAHPGVSHGYERDHYYNIWFTLAIPTADDMETEVQKLISPIVAEIVLILPAIKVFKIGTYFDMDKGSKPVSNAPIQSSSNMQRKVDLSQTERAVINVLQQDLPLISNPFDSLSAQLSMDVEEFLAQCRSLKERGIMRRFSASINHNKAGFNANAMTCWTAPSTVVETAGYKLASLKEVSHCYERKTNSLWLYNLFAMIHSHAREACQEFVKGVSGEIGLSDYVLLFSTKEFKKTRVKYTV